MPESRSLSALGDPRWISASPRFATYAPLVVLSLLVLSIIQVALGGVWVSTLQGRLIFTDLLQPIVLPSLSFFNAVPSAQLHILAGSNEPTMAICFSSLMALLYLASAVVSLVACSSTNTTSFQRKECPFNVNYDHGFSGTGPSQGEWDAAVALWLCSVVGYGVHVAMAWRVRSVLRKRVRQEAAGPGHGGDTVALEWLTMDPETKVRDRQQRIVDL